MTREKKKKQNKVTEEKKDKGIRDKRKLSPQGTLGLATQRVRLHPQDE
jgi:hypothetical protein